MGFKVCRRVSVKSRRAGMGNPGDIMQDGIKVMFKFLCFMMACSLIGLSGCRKDSDRLDGEPLSEVLLRYTPQIGLTNHYGFSVNLDKKFFLKGKWRSEGNEKQEGIISIKSIEQNGDNYHTKWDARMGNSNLSKETMDIMKDRAAKSSSEYDVMYDINNIDNICRMSSPLMARRARSFGGQGSIN
jgi:hypothetical protein